jgi:hypothetical protein
LRQLRQRAHKEDKAGDRARRMLEYLESGNPDDAKFEGVSLYKLQSAIERTKSRTRAKNSNAPAEDRAATGSTLQSMIEDVSQGNPDDIWVDGVNVTRLEKWLTRLQRRAAGTKALHELPVRDSVAASAPAAPTAHVETASTETPRATRTQGKADRQPEWIEDFLE